MNPTAPTSNRLSRRTPPSLISIAAALCVIASAAAETYTVTRITPPAGVESSSVDGLNNAGEVVGNTKVKAGRSSAPGPAFVWANGSTTVLPPLPGDSAAEAHAINDSGLVVGHSPRMNVYSYYPRAVWWQPTGTGGYTVGNWNTLLPPGSSMQLGSAVAISGDGLFVLFDSVDSVTGRDQAMVGQVALVGGIPSAFSAIWPIESLNGAVSSDGFVSAGIAVTHDGNGVVRVTGYALAPGSYGHAFLWEKDVVSDTTSLIDLDHIQSTFSSGEGVNNLGQSVGNVGSSASKAYIWASNGVAQLLPTLGGARTWVSSINDAGSVVGWSQRSGKNVSNHAYIWNVSIGMRDLNSIKAPGDTSGLELTNAHRINGVGQILGYGVNRTGSTPILLKPIP